MNQMILRGRQPIRFPLAQTHTDNVDTVNDDNGFIDRSMNLKVCRLLIAAAAATCPPLRCNPTTRRTRLPPLLGRFLVGYRGRSVAYPPSTSRCDSSPWGAGGHATAEVGSLQQLEHFE